MKSDKKRILLKIGTSTLTKESKFISRGKIEDIGRQLVKLKDHYEFIIVSSGAIAVARQFVNIEGSGKEITVKQALASIGQPHLMRIIQESFRELGLLTAQCLLSYMDFEHAQSRTNIINTICVLLENDYIPVINENDTVATEEIQFGDNDKLAAKTAVLVEADLLVLATNTFGIYEYGADGKSNQSTIERIHDLNEVKQFVSDQKSEQGSGGMQSKIIAAEIAQSNGIETWILNGLQDDFLLKAINKTTKFSRVLAG